MTHRKATRGFPILSPLSDLKDFDFAQPLGKYRFFEVMADNVPGHYLWRGNVRYTLEVVEYLLNKGEHTYVTVTVTVECFHMIFRPYKSYAYPRCSYKLIFKDPLCLCVCSYDSMVLY